jgi:hypothetical protein
MKEFGDAIELVGVDLKTPSAVAGEPALLTLYWRTLDAIDSDFSVFVHATDSAGILQAQRDTYPGLGNRPTSTWQPGTLYADPHEIRLPETILAADTLTITAGLYDYATGQRLLTVDGRDEAVLGVVHVEPAAERPRVDFGGTLAMTDWSLNRATLRPGETLTATIVWEAQRKPERDYVVFAHLVRPQGEVWAQEDDQPEPRTSSWSTGSTVTVTHEMRLSEDAPPGDYQVEVGVYDAETLERLQVDFSDAGIVIGRVRVE